MTPLRVLLALVVAMAVLSACGKKSSAPDWTWHSKVKATSSIKEVEKACGGLRKCPVDHPELESVEYSADASGKINGILLTFKGPKEASVEASKNIFLKQRNMLNAALGNGKSYLDTGNPTYWPARDPAERVVMITTGFDEKTVVGIGPVGPDATKIPAGGKAHDLAEVQAYWAKIAPKLAPKKKK